MRTLHLYALPASIMMASSAVIGALSALPLGQGFWLYGAAIGAASGLFLCLAIALTTGRRSAKVMEQGMTAAAAIETMSTEAAREATILVLDAAPTIAKRRTSGASTVPSHAHPSVREVFDRYEHICWGEEKQCISFGEQHLRPVKDMPGWTVIGRPLNAFHACEDATGRCILLMNDDRPVPFSREDDYVLSIWHLLLQYASMVEANRRFMG